MTALNFMARFAGDVEARIKRQSIRGNGSRFHVGHPIQLYTGMRTRACRKLSDVDPLCISVEPIEIRPGRILLAGRLLEPIERRDFAVSDGFGHVLDFYAFFKVHDTAPYLGSLIKWDWP